jgi:hypothetical protein
VNAFAALQHAHQSIRPMRIPHGTLSLQRKMGLYTDFHAFLLLLAGLRQTLKGPSQVGCTIVQCTICRFRCLLFIGGESATMLRKQKLPAEWSRRRTRYDPPTLAEAITAVQCLTDQIESQIKITAQLMGVPEEEVRSEVLTATPLAPPRDRQSAFKTAKLKLSWSNEEVLAPCCGERPRNAGLRLPIC